MIKSNGSNSLATLNVKSIRSDIASGFISNAWVRLKKQQLMRLIKQLKIDSKPEYLVIL